MLSFLRGHCAGELHLIEYCARGPWSIQNKNSCAVSDSGKARAYEFCSRECLLRTNAVWAALVQLRS